MESNQRRDRIFDLQKRIRADQEELNSLLLQESGLPPVEQEAVITQCRILKSQREVIRAIKLYRTTFGCGLREAQAAVSAL